MIHSYIQSVSELKNVELTAHQILRILNSPKPFCVIVGGLNIHLVEDPQKLIRERYKDEPVSNVAIYDLNN
jgi:hypothetical protein